MIFPQIHKGAKTLSLHFPTKAPNPKFEAAAQPTPLPSAAPGRFGRRRAPCLLVYNADGPTGGTIFAREVG